MLTASLCDWRYSHADLLFIEVCLFTEPEECNSAVKHADKCTELMQIAQRHLKQMH